MSSLPRYKKPPVIEVAVSVQFDAIEGLQIPHIGLIWQEFKDRFPNVEQHPTLPPVVERLQPTGAEQPKISFSTAVETPRVWFVSEDGCDLVQIQPNRFTRNWRKQPTETREYPHYEPHIKPSFLDDLKVFRQSLTKIGLADISINQCEITYVNHILPNAIWKTHDQLSNLLKLWPTEASEILGPSMENAGAKFDNQIMSNENEFIGRTHFDIQPRYLLKTDQSPAEYVPIFVCNMTARGRPASTDDGFVRFLDLGRKKLVELFEKIFTEEAQASWEKE